MKVGALEVPEAGLREFCRKWRITEFAVFGSVLREDFGAESDVDVLVTFEDGTRWRLRDFGEMRSELTDLLGRPVDMVEREAVVENPNWLTRREILGSARVFDACGSWR